jgi:hypothetical protein
MNQPLEQTSLKLLEKTEQKAQHFNGRIDIMGQLNDKQLNNQFELFDKPHIKNNNTSYHNALTGIWCDNMLSKAFFSSQNVQMIQNGLRYGVYKLSNGRYIIDEQDVTNLHIIMRSIYLEYAANQDINIPEQIQKLNNLVLDYCIPSVFNEVESYMKYKNDVSTLPVPPSRPAFVSGKGDKVLEMSNRWFNPPKPIKFTPESSFM